MKMFSLKQQLVWIAQTWMFTDISQKKVKCFEFHSPTAVKTYTFTGTKYFELTLDVYACMHVSLAIVLLVL